MQEITLPRLIGSDVEVCLAEESRNRFIRKLGDRITDWSETSAAYELMREYILASTWNSYSTRPTIIFFILRTEEIEFKRKVKTTLELLKDKISAEKALATQENKVYAIVYKECIIVNSDTRENLRLPPGGHWHTLYGNDFRFELEDLDDLLNCNSILFILNSEGVKLK